MRVLVYKRTHIGDPDEDGCFGCNCCMGRIREWPFDAVVGIGGIGQVAVRHSIDRKITWIGRKPHRIGFAADGYPTWGFERFWSKDEKGPLLHEIAPKLAKRLFAMPGPRSLVLEPDDELEAILKLAKHASPSPTLIGKSPAAGHCCSRQVIRGRPRRHKK